MRVEGPMNGVNMQELFDRIRASGDETPILNLEELIALETWLPANRRRRSFAEEQRAARGDLELKAKIEGEKAGRRKLRHTASYNRALRDEGLIPAAPPAPAAAESPSTVDRTVVAEGDSRADQARPDHAKARTLADCTLDFWPDRIELLGEILARARGLGNDWVILRALREAYEAVPRLAITAKQLAKRFVPPADQDAAVHSSICRLRRRIDDVLRRHGVDAAGTELVQSRREGYALGSRLRIVPHDRDAGRGAGASPAEKRPLVPRLEPDDVPGPAGTADVPAGTTRVPAGTFSDPPGTSAVPAAPLPPQFGGRLRKGGSAGATTPGRPTEREAWVLKAVRGGRQLQRKDVERGLEIGEKTAKRLLAAMTRAGLIEWVANPKPGHYRRAKRK
jgi:hypothetical protein